MNTRVPGRATILAIDPGLDRLSIAVFRLPLDGARGSGRWWSLAPTERKVLCLEGVVAKSTHPETPLPMRLGDLARFAAFVANDSQPDLVLIERPAISGLYRRNVKRAGVRVSGDAILASMDTMHMALGAVAGRLAEVGWTVEFVKAQGGKKEDRLAAVRANLTKYRPDLPTIRNKDDLDAIGIGLGAHWPF